MDGGGTEKKVIGKTENPMLQVIKKIESPRLQVIGKDADDNFQVPALPGESLEQAKDRLTAELTQHTLTECSGVTLDQASYLARAFIEKANFRLVPSVSTGADGGSI